MLWQESQALSVTPSTILGLTQGSYEAYCLDQAIWYFGSTVQSELERAGQKKAKGEAQLINARKRVLAKYLGKDAGAQQYATPVYPEG
jgi:hypothetical protein